jgi:4-hydroxybenzoate polyprenyltransferase
MNAALVGGTITTGEAIAAAPGVFLFGVLVGLVLASRYRIRKVNGDRPPP